MKALNEHFSLTKIIKYQSLLYYKCKMFVLCKLSKSTNFHSYRDAFSRKTCTKQCS